MHNAIQPVGQVVLLLSGPIAVGKTHLASGLESHLGFERVRSGAFLLRRAQTLGRQLQRSDLQALGDELDESTDFRWLIDEVVLPSVYGKPSQVRWLIDAVRKKRQVDHFREAFGGDVVHVHLIAAEETLKARYDSRIANGEEYLGNTSYEEAIQHPNEISSRGLYGIADYVVNVQGKGLHQIVVEIALVLGFKTR